jgi:GDP-L-fucose synthase
MKVLVTGASGMVGRNLIKGIVDCGWDPVSIDRDICNLQDPISCFNVIKENNPDAIVHCAGLVGGIHINMKYPYEFFVVNMQLGMNIFDAAIKNKIPKFINLGSSCMYPKNITSLKESDLLGGEIEKTNEGYGLAKLATAKLTEICNKQFSTDYKTLIPCNLFGKWDKFDPDKSHMIPAVIRKVYEAKIQNSNTCEIWGDGTGRREFMYAEDLVDFILFALQNYNSIPQYCNVGLGYDYTINEYHETVAKIIGYKGNFSHDLSKPSGVDRRLLDISSQTLLDWKPNHSLEEGIEKTFDYFKSII